MLVLSVNTSISMLNRGGMCPIVYRGGAMNTLNSSGNFKASPSYCHASPAEERSLNETKHFRNLDFATTSYGCFTPKLDKKLLQTTSNFPIHKNREIGEFRVEFATSSA